MNESQIERPEPLRGFAFAGAAYLFWGFMPLLMKALDHVPAAEIVAHRVIWSLPVAAIILVAMGRTGDIAPALRSPRTLVMATLTAALISLNWGIYIWAIAVDRTVETALGYYINPLVTVLMGAVLLGERLSRAQVVAVGLAAIAVAILTWDAGGLPWVSLVLAFTFAGYGFLRKTLPIGPSQGFFLEVLILTPPAILWLGYLAATGPTAFGFDMPLTMALLILCGPATAIPLILYAFGAKLLKISSIGIMQYIAPTIIATIAVFVFGEPFGTARLVAFGFIWAALAIYTWSMFSQRKLGAAEAVAATSAR